MKTYTGERTKVGRNIVRVDGAHLRPRNDLRNHSPDGFEWGYAGSGPAQLSLALLANHLDDNTEAMRLYQHFKAKVVQHIGTDTWELTSGDIDHALDAIRNKESKR